MALALDTPLGPIRVTLHFRGEDDALALFFNEGKLTQYLEFVESPLQVSEGVVIPMKRERPQVPGYHIKIDQDRSIAPTIDTPSSEAAKTLQIRLVAAGIQCSLDGAAIEILDHTDYVKVIRVFEEALDVRLLR